jgi:N-acetylmuramoyl-L-alanine amidase
MIVCIDPGHGDYDPGAIGPNGTREKDIALLMALQVGKILQAANVKVVYTRTSDQSKALAERVVLANESGADLFVSIHCNSVTNPTAHGMEVYTTPGQGKADLAAEEIVRAWLKYLPGHTIRKDLSDGDSDKEANFYVLRYTTMPAVLVETAFISNPREEQKLKSANFQAKAAQAIAEGILQYLNVPVPRGKAMGKPALIFQDTTYVPLKGFLAAIGAGEITGWEQGKQEATFTHCGTTYSIRIGSDLVTPQ